VLCLSTNIFGILTMSKDGKAGKASPILAKGKTLLHQLARSESGLAVDAADRLGSLS
jgi:hypothetical protein